MEDWEGPWPADRVRPTAPDGVVEQRDGGDAEVRYEHDPQLAVIESYALDVIGELAPDEVAEVQDAVAGLFGDSPDWHHRVRQRLGWNPMMDATIADGWCRFRQLERQRGGDPDPAEFARRFADEVTRLSRT